MELSDRLLIEIAGSSATGQQLKRERRGATRLPVRRKGTLLRNGRSLSVLVREVSTTGASLMGPELIPAGEEFVLSLPGLKGRVFELACAVVRCERIAGSRMVIIGVAFQELLRVEAAPVPSAAEEPTELDRIKHAVLD